jgi:hypothetical protein
MKRIALLGLIGAATLTGCNAGQVDAVAEALGIHLTDGQSQAVADHYNQPHDCYGAIERVWPARLQSWARRIVWRESRNQPGAGAGHAAKGCFQIKLPLHADRFRAVGCAPGQWADPMCNVAAAWNLYQGTGAGPWAL